MEAVDEENAVIVSWRSTELTTIIVTTLNMGKSYRFRVGSVDAAERMSNWSQPVSLAMQGLPLYCNHKIARNYFLCCHGHAVPPPVEIVTATINQISQMNYSITVDWKVTMLACCCIDHALFT